MHNLIIQESITKVPEMDGGDKMNKDIRKVNTSYYTYINLNPKDKYVSDCVVRAIALATNQSWKQTVMELTELGVKKGLVLNDKTLYPKYLESKGFVLRKEPRDYNNKKMSVKEWLISKKISPENHKSVIVANVGSHHVTCIINGTVHDTWNSSNQTMHKYWEKKK